MLGVAKTATDEEIKRAYRKLARKHHPDLNPGDKSAEAKFKEINEANEVLGDPEKRRKYDELGANWRQYEQQAAAGRAAGVGGGFGRAARRLSDGEPRGNGADVRSAARRRRSPTSSRRSSAAAASHVAGGPARAIAPSTARPRRRGRGGTDARRSVCRHDAEGGPVPRNGKDHTVEVRIPAGIKDGARDSRGRRRRPLERQRAGRRSVPVRARAAAPALRTARPGSRTRAPRARDDGGAGRRNRRGRRCPGPRCASRFRR